MYFSIEKSVAFLFPLSEFQSMKSALKLAFEIKMKMSVNVIGNKILSEQYIKKCAVN